MIREAFQDLNRVRQIGVIAAKHGFGELLDRAGLWRALGRREQVEVSPDAPRTSTARRFRMLLNDLGPTFVKLGQILSTRADLLPAEYIEELSTLQDQVAPIPLEQVRAQMRHALGQDAEALFAWIDPEPMAAASIAQVHRARTQAGDEVVVKVQRPGIADQIRSDLAVLRSLARLLEAVVEETGIYTPIGLVDEFDKAIHEELDFLNEASNVKAFYENHRGREYIRVPRVFEALSSGHVLTLEYIEGVKISQVDLTKHDRIRLSRNIVEGAFRQLFVDGLFHGDPHPGNILVLDADVLALLDFGVVGRVPKHMQDTLVMLVLAVALKDSDSVARIMYRIGAANGKADLAGFKRDIDGILTQHLPRTLGEVNTKALLTELLDLAVKYRIRIPKEYALLSRAAVATEGLLRTLNPTMNIMEVVLPYAKELMWGRYDPSQLQGGMLRTLFRLQGLASDLPVQLSQILLDLESGKFAVNVRAEEFSQMTAAVRTASVIAFLGLCACGFIVGSFMSFAQHPWTWRGFPVLGLLGIAAAAALFGATFTWYLFGGRFHKVRILPYLRRRKRAAARAQ